MNELSITERHGMSFEERCQLALDCLQSMRIFIRDSADGDLEVLQRNVTEAAKLEQNFNDAERKALSAIVEQLGESFREILALQHGAMWREAEQFSRDAYGDDATDFALAILERQSGAN